MGVRDSSRLLPAALLTICLLLAGVLAQDAAAHTAGRAHHRSKSARRHAQRVQRTRARHQTAAKPQPARPRTKDVRPQAVRERETSEKRNRTADAAAAAAATIASVLATPCQNTEITPEAGNIEAARSAVLCLVNRERAEHSLAPLKENQELAAAAEDHNAEMLQVDYFAHVAPDGETPVERIKKTGYIVNESDGYVIGENLAWGTYSLSTPKAIVEAWIASPGHLANILESRYTETGVGVTPAVPNSLGEGNPGATYAQEFGVIVR